MVHVIASSVSHVRSNIKWQAHTKGAFDPSHFAIDWEPQKVTCPAGHTSSSWTPSLDNRGSPVVKIKFAYGACRACAERDRCIRHQRRSLTIRPRERHEALIANRKRQATPEFKAECARRSVGY